MPVHFRGEFIIPKNTNKKNGGSCGYAFVDLATPSDAERAIAQLCGKDIGGRKIYVSRAKEPKQRGNKPKKGAPSINVHVQDTTSVAPLAVGNHALILDGQDLESTGCDGPPANGSLSKNKVMVSNIPKVISKKQVREFPAPIFWPELIIRHIADGTLLSLQSFLR